MGAGWASPVVSMMMRRNGGIWPPARCVSRVLRHSVRSSRMAQQMHAGAQNHNVLRDRIYQQMIDCNVT